MSGGCQVDVRWITSPLSPLSYLSHLSYWSYSPYSANLANQPTFFQNYIYTRLRYNSGFMVPRLPLAKRQPRVTV